MLLEKRPFEERLAIIGEPYCLHDAVCLVGGYKETWLETIQEIVRIAFPWEYDAMSDTNNVDELETILSFYGCDR
jgi:hypothetical protein